jgi:hypothetical protein
VKFVFIFGDVFWWAMSQAESQKCPPPTKKKTAPAREQNLANGRVKRQLYQTQRQIAEELSQIPEIRDPAPDHIRLLQLCQLGAANDFSTSQLAEMGGFRFPLMLDAREFFAADFLKKPGFSEEEVDLHVEKCFKSFYDFAKKPGRKALPPKFMVQLTLHIKQKQYVERNFDCATDMENFWRDIVLDCAAKIGFEVPEVVRSVKFSLFKILCPKGWRGEGKWAIKHRNAAALDPCGAISMAAAWPIVMEGVHPKCTVFFDKMTHLLGHDAPKKCRLSAEVQELLAAERRSPTFTRGMGQERSFGITLGEEKSQGLLTCCFHICDETITEIRCEKIADKFHVMFEPYSAKSEQAARENLGGGMAAQETESLAMRTANKWISEVQIPAMRSWRQSLMDEAESCGHDPRVFERMVASFDGEQSHLHSLMDNHSLTLFLDNIFGFKIPAGHSGNIAVPDVCPIFAILHSKLIKGMKEATQEEIDGILAEEAGLRRIMQIISGLNGMSTPSKETFKKALVLGFSYVKATVNVSTVSKGCRDACIFPFNRDKMIKKMWPAYSTLPAEVQEFVCAKIDGPISNEYRTSGWCLSSFIERHISMMESTIVFPPRSADFDRFQWNRQTSVITGHASVMREHQQRRLIVAEAAAVAADISLTKEESKRRLQFRMTKCTVGTDAATLKSKCGCGRLFDGVGGFNGHEKSSHHQTHYNGRDWEAEFIAAHPAPPGAAVPGAAP